MNSMFISAAMDYSKPIEGFTDTLSFGGMMVLLGLATVFSVLLIIMLALFLFKYFFYDLSSKGSQKEDSNTATAPVMTVAPTVASQDEEIVAVIAAAIAMAESEESGVKFKVVSFRRI